MLWVIIRLTSLWFYYIYICHVYLQTTERRVSLGDGEWRPAKDPSPHFKSNTIGAPKSSTMGVPKSNPIAVPKSNTIGASKSNEPFKPPAIPSRRTSVDVCLPLQLPSPSSSRHMQPMPLPVLPQSGCKTVNKRPALGGEAILPPNLLNELNSVLNKTGRTNKNNDWQEETWGGNYIKYHDHFWKTTQY